MSVVGLRRTGLGGLRKVLQSRLFGIGSNSKVFLIVSLLLTPHPLKALARSYCTCSFSCEILDIWDSVIGIIHVGIRCLMPTENICQKLFLLNANLVAALICF